MSAGCPCLVRVFCAMDKHRDEHDYSDLSRLPERELRAVHVRGETTLSELTESIFTVNPRLFRECSANKVKSVSVALVYPDKHGIMTLRQCGTLAYPLIKPCLHSHRPNRVSDQSLTQCEFESGDFVELAFLRK